MNAITLAKTIPITEIKPYWRNPRQNDLAVDAVVESIKVFGYVSPIIVDSESIIIAGHTRYRALMRLGYTEVDVVVKDLEPRLARAYRIADNKTAEIAVWDKGELTAELRDLDFAGLLPMIDFSDLESFKPPVIDGGSLGMDKVQQERDEKLKQGFFPMSCPECGVEFFVTKADVLKRQEVTTGEFRNHVGLNLANETYELWRKWCEKAKTLLGYDNPSKAFEFAIVEAMNMPDESLKP